MSNPLLETGAYSIPICSSPLIAFWLKMAALTSASQLDVHCDPLCQLAAGKPYDELFSKLLTVCCHCSL